MSVIETVGLTKDYDYGHIKRSQRRALDHLDLSVEDGEIFGLIGPNGAGKTTTLKLLMGLVFPSEGRASILERAVDDPAVKRQIGYLPEHPYFYDYLTGRELLLYFGQLFGLQKTERRNRAYELLEKVGMLEAADEPLRKYSKGMTQRIGIAQALINRPRIVFLDEPMSGLDPVGRREMTELVRELRASGVTVLFCSHILSDVEALCDRVAILNKGRLIESGSLSDILDVSVQNVEVVLAGASDALEKKITENDGKVHRSGARLHASFVTAAAFDSLLGAVSEDGASIVSVTPVKQRLEDHFVQELLKEPSP